MNELFVLQCDALGSGAVLAGFRTEAQIGSLFRVELLVTVPIAEVPNATDVLGSVATVTTSHEGTESHTSGIVVRLASLLVVGERALVQLELAPRLATLGQSKHSRVFTDQSVPDIWRAVLEGAGLGGEDFEFRLTGSYPTEPHVCQYKESDLAFLTRLMEREGAHYFFEHAVGSHKLVIADHGTAHTALRSSPVRYHPVPGGDLGVDSFDSLRVQRSLRPKKVRLTDYDDQHPSLDLGVEATVAEGTGGVLVDHGRGYRTPSDGRRLAAVAAEALTVHGRTFDAVGTAFHLAPGGTLELSEHPRTDRNREYLCVAMVASGCIRSSTDEIRARLGLGSRDTFVVRARLVESDAPFRLEPASPAPRIFGLERALVDGPAASDYAQLDAEGRYHVKLAFDEGELTDGKASLPVRMMQPHAGNPEGMHLPLRKGTEVLLAFVGGAPNQPVIAGAVPNSETPSPVRVSNATRNIIWTGGDNVIEIEDEEGKQWIDLRTPVANTYFHLGTPHNPTHYVVGYTDGNCRFTIGKNQDIRVGGKLTEEVTGEVKETYGTAQTSTVTGPQKTTVTNAVEEIYSGGQWTGVTKAVTEIYCSGQKTTVGGARTERYEADQTTIVVGGAQLTYSVPQDLTVTGPSCQTYNGTKMTVAGGQVQHKLDGPVLQLFGPTTAIHATTEWKIPGNADWITNVWSLAAPGNGWVTNMVNALKLNRTDVTGLVLALIGTKIEPTGLSVGVAGYKAEAAAVVRSAFGVALSIKGLSIASDGFNDVTAAFKKAGV